MKFYVTVKDYLMHFVFNIFCKFFRISHQYCRIRVYILKLLENDLLFISIKLFYFNIKTLSVVNTSINVEMGIREFFEDSKFEHHELILFDHFTVFILVM